jgi:hypothetical protein
MTEHDHGQSPVRIAFILDNVVADVIYTDERLAAIFLSDPVVIDVTDHQDVAIVTADSTYDPATQRFTAAPPRQSESFPIMPEDVVTVEDDETI